MCAENTHSSDGQSILYRSVHHQQTVVCALTNPYHCHVNVHALLTLTVFVTHCYSTGESGDDIIQVTYH